MNQSPNNQAHRPRHLSVVHPHLPIDTPQGTVLEQALNSGRPIAGSIRRYASWVGGLPEFETLDDDPVPDEPFDWAAVETCDREFIAQVLALADAHCDRWLDVQYRTIARRILARAAGGDPRVFRRSHRADKCAAGLVWLMLRANNVLGRRTRRETGELWYRFGVPSSPDRGYALQQAADLRPARTGDEQIDWNTDHLLLGDATLLHSRTRRWLIDTRTKLTEQAADMLAKQSARRPLRDRGDGQVEVRGVPAKPLIAAKGLSEEGRAIVMIGFGESDDDAKLFAVTIPDAHDLLAMVQRALDAPLPRARHGT